MVVKPFGEPTFDKYGLRVVLSHMVVKQRKIRQNKKPGLRVVLSHMVVKPNPNGSTFTTRLRVVLSHMVVKHRRHPTVPE